MKRLPAGVLAGVMWGLLIAFPCSLTAQGTDGVAGSSTPVVPDLRIRMVWEGGRTTLDTGERTTGDFQVARTQAGLTLFPSSRIRLRARLAGLIHSNQEEVRFLFQSHAPGPGGLRPGDWTVDDLHLDFRPAPGWQVRAGRFQTSFALPAVIARSLDRIDSPSAGVTWTDGVHLAAPVGPGLQGQLILQHNPAAGPSNALRPPLDFTAPASRVGIFAALTSSQPRGRILGHGVDLTLHRQSVPTPGDGGSDGGSGVPGTFTALVGRAAFLVWDELPAGGRLVVGVEGGAATGAPQRSVVGVGRSGQGRSQGLASLVSVSLLDLGGRHSLGGSFASVGDGWLISPSFLPNFREVEGRYRVRLHPRAVAEARVRGRKQVIPNTGRTGRRGETNGFLRMTITW